ncbi:tRNA uridine(34) 5-carboxymethylaminomethyl modification radical SAM/GNAT enzyme Elp3 [Candidatus Micrarchaeota archaeon]|nr:tRNA uridine(34) 5-carboxymethylaminomethyl modification radical SAM/GNAT enzyme Elp3 [Candidatus Micrarchaeota archaeon]
MQAVEQIVEEIEKTPSLTSENINGIKKRIGKQHGLSEVVSNADILEKLSSEKRRELKKALRVRNVRSLSGVSVIAIMTKPAGCPGKCTYCPGGITSPKSYTGFEPAAARAKQNNFDAFLQVQTRLAQLENIGHNPQKCDVIVMGATFNAFPRSYQLEFVKRAFEGFNGAASQSIEEAHLVNESAKHRVIGLTFETRPDWCTEDDAAWFLSLGATRIELGIQSLDDEALKKVERGHGVSESIEATRRCKDAFLKVCHHFMPGLYSYPEKDIDMFRRIFQEESFRPDMIKIYPCLVLPNTPLFQEWKKGNFLPYNSQQAADVIARCKQFIPPYCRVMRVDRDIPTTLVAAGVKNSNLRQLVEAQCKELGIKCVCIRCREVGLKSRFDDIPAIEEAEMQRIAYKASGGEEVFISFEAGDALFGFCRLRKPGKPFLKEIDDHTLGIRELHVYGDATPIGESPDNPHRNPEHVQHRGIGRALLREAEKIAREEFDGRKLLVISGVGAREYYRKAGFEKIGHFMGKNIS